ncbi:hypothetical protein P175DRAFT_055081 [Aspergillus ochraceoroseus IBT 24754]|uniref:Uncharacterized protein n=1 Tax=Aspergillus ochraceoroseus IBT 24754 TaxID=1392256 RepID=A0A2T5M8N2_9EURO|nr:uncharacterized protein P175DRAFT_055081 [Aspergillus ochraceoroseus IBT 24754]PTU24896.1 hypothetical protein P175DRAFT_055081 [Aspergillus ochraceoroseus IBT 24754]
MRFPRHSPRRCCCSLPLFPSGFFFSFLFFLPHCHPWTLWACYFHFSSKIHLISRLVE